MHFPSFKNVNLITITLFFLSFCIFAHLYYTSKNTNNVFILLHFSTSTELYFKFSRISNKKTFIFLKILRIFRYLSNIYFMYTAKNLVTKIYRRMQTFFAFSGHQICAKNFWHSLCTQNSKISYVPCMGENPQTEA